MSKINVTKLSSWKNHIACYLINSNNYVQRKNQCFNNQSFLEEGIQAEILNNEQH